ncbi:FixH family protein [Armatimonas sp.]|uniref:FixH family protein n=1 Tax=Armatimonas sp. TaxID=1872638 RepID=UPI00286D3294|nr:FixH family protein [Armatimonas sp.]
MFTTQRALLSALTLGALLSALPPTFAQVASAPAGLQKTIGKYTLTLRLPTEGIFAGEQVDIEFRLLDTSKIDPVAGATGVMRVQTKAIVTMPEMAGMPAQSPKIHTEGVPGDYGIECFFPHGGQYQIALSLTLPGEAKPIKASFLIDVQDAEARQSKRPLPKPYLVEVKSVGAAEANKPAELRFTIRDTKTKAIVKDFDIAHTKVFHLLMASKDLSWFAHEHPVPQPDGTFTISQVFPAGGEYRIYADVAPKGAGSQILGTNLRVGGATPKPVALIPSGTKNTVAGITASFSSAVSPIPIGKSTSLIFKLTNTVSGQPITDLEQYLGAFGHLMIIHQDGQTVVHSHPAEDEAGLAASKKGNVVFNARFPKPGIYKAWGQFQRGGQVITIPFVVKVGVS